MYKIDRRGGVQNRSLRQTHYLNLLDVRESIDIKNRSLGNYPNIALLHRAKVQL